MQDALQRVVDLGAVAHRLGERRRTDRRDHELLEVRRALGVGAAVEDVEQRHRQQRRLLAAEVPVQRNAGVRRRSVRHRQRDAEDRVRAELRLVRRAVQLDHRLVERALVAGVHAAHLRRDRLVDVGDRLQHALAAVAPGVAVAQLQRFVDAGRCARWHRRRTARAALKLHCYRNVGFPRESRTSRARTLDILLDITYSDCNARRSSASPIATTTASIGSVTRSIFSCPVKPW